MRNLITEYNTAIRNLHANLEAEKQAAIITARRQMAEIKDNLNRQHRSIQERKRRETERLEAERDRLAGDQRRNKWQQPQQERQPTTNGGYLAECFKTLGFSSKPTKRQLRKAYARLSKQHHPDKGGNAATFRAISEAYNQALNLL